MSKLNESELSGALDDLADIMHDLYGGDASVTFEVIMRLRELSDDEVLDALMRLNDKARIA